LRFFNINNILQTGRRLLSNLTDVSESIVTDSRRLTDTLKGMQDRLIALEGKAAPEATEFELDVGELGNLVKVNHGFNCPVRWYVTSWKSQPNKPAVQYSVPERPSWLTFYYSTMLNSIGDFTVGSSWRMKVYKEIVGIRFLYQNNGTTSYNVRCVLWNNTSGSVLAEKTVSVNKRGYYHAIFDLPVTVDLTGTDITTSVYDLSGARNWADVAQVNGINIEFPDMTLVNGRLFSAGNARPTSNGNDHPVEPILGNYVTGPQLVVDGSSTLNILALRSYTAGRAILRIEPSQYTVS